MDWIKEGGGVVLLIFSKIYLEWVDKVEIVKRK